MASDRAARLTDLANRLTAISNEIEAREEAFERDMVELRNTRAQLAQELRAVTQSLIGDVRPTRAASRPPQRRNLGQRQSAEEREQQVLELVASSGDGLNGKDIADRLGVSTATATKTINALLERGAIRAEG